MAQSIEMDRAGAIKAGGGTLLGFWFEETLGESLPLSEDHSNEQRELRIAAAREAVMQLAPEDAGLGARMIALQFVCSHSAGLDYQAQAFSRHLPPDARAISQRFANQLMGLSGRQLGVLNRLEAERRQAKESAARRAHLDRQYAWKQDVNFTRALADSMDRFLGDPKAMAAAFTGAPRGEMPPAAAGNGSRPGTENGAAQAEPEAAMPLTRQQRRALERREKKQARRAATAAAA